LRLGVGGRTQALYERRRAVAALHGQAA
jgi:hypothetical protein